MRNSRNILVSSRDSTEAIQRLFEQHKADFPRTSLSSLCKKAGISSKGYLSDVLHGRRKLATKHQAGIAAGFGLGDAESRHLNLLISLDHATDDDRSRLQHEIANSAKSLSIHEQDMPRRLFGRFFPYEVFCAVALFQNQGTLDDLAGYFGAPRRLEIEKALDILMKEGLIGEENGRYAHVRDKVIFTGQGQPEAKRQFISLTLKDVEQKLARWLPETDLSHFHSTIITVNKEKYRSILPKIRDMLRSCEADMENEDADMIIRFSAQIHPLK